MNHYDQLTIVARVGSKCVEERYAENNIGRKQGIMYEA